jgi:CheY-like chemotaxis protein
MLPEMYNVPIVSWPWLGEDSRFEDILTYLVKPVSPEALHAVMSRVERTRGDTVVLVVDDEPEAVRLIEATLTAMPRPYRILRAFSGAQALALIKATPPDVVLLDLVMPEMDGIETLAAMRTLTHPRRVPVVVISGRDQVDGQIALETPISLRCQRPLAMATGVRLLGAMLDAVAADYLEDAAPRESPPGARPGRSVSATPGLHPAPGPDQAGSVPSTRSPGHQPAPGRSGGFAAASSHPRGA